jgi:arylsulfatase A-like enzyme
LKSHLCHSLFLFLLTLAAFLLPGTACAGEKVNVIVILADDLGYGDLGCYGHPKFKTPNLDRLAKEGVRLTNAYVPVPFCAPTRGALMTGRYPMRNGLITNPVPKEDPIAKKGDDVGLPIDEVTLVDLLRQAGYRTKCVGKWHLGHQAHFRPLKRGFDDYYGILYSNDMHRVELFENDKKIEYPVVQATLTKRYTEQAIEFIIRNKGRPFFLYLAHAMPHKPLACSEAFYKKSGAGLYGDVMAELDWSVGQIMETLRELGLEKNTLVVFTSDNGPWYGGSTGGLRGMKGQNWEGGLRVPFIARWTGRIPAGRTSHEPAIIMDVFATALSATGTKSAKNRVLDGRDLLPVLTKDAKSPHEALFSFRGEQIATVRGGKWKLHLVPPAPMAKLWKPEDKYVDPRAPDGVRLLAPYEQAHASAFPGVTTGDPVTKLALFDLDKDMAEQRNVAAEHPDVVARLQGYAARFMKDLASDRLKESKRGSGGP